MKGLRSFAHYIKKLEGGQKAVLERYCVAIIDDIFTTDENSDKVVTIIHGYIIEKKKETLI